MGPIPGSTLVASVALVPPSRLVIVNPIKAYERGVFEERDERETFL